MNRLAYILLFCLLYSLRSMAALPVSVDTLTTDQKIEQYNDSILKVQSKYAEQIKARGTVLDSISKISAPFDARDYIMQRRFTKKGKMELYPQHWYERLSFGAYSGIQTIAKRGDTDVTWAIPAGLFARYEFNRLHSLRLSYQNVDYNVGRRECDMSTDSYQLDYLLNLSNYFAGYNPERIFNASIAAGVGYAHNTYKAETKSAFLGQLGMNMSFRLGGHSHFFLEPFVAFASDDIDYSEETNSHQYDIVYGVKAGFSIDTYGGGRSKVKGQESKVWGQRSNALGVASGIAILPSNEDIYLDNELTSSTSVTYTRWFDSVVGLRIGGTLNYFNSAKQGLAQADIMLNTLNLFPSYRNLPSPRFEWDLAFGGRAGWQWRTDLSNSIYGFSVSSPLLFRVTSRFSLGLEPGVQWMTYTIPYTNYTNFRKRISDPSYSFTLAFRYDF